VSIRIFSLSGQEIETIESGLRQRGKHTIRWDAGQLPAGIVLYRFRAGEWSETGKLILLKEP